MMQISSVNDLKSRYVHGGTTEVNSPFLKFWDRRDFQSAVDDNIYIMERQYVGKLTALSTAVYGDPLYWWVIAQYNNIVDPLVDAPEGAVLYLPTKERLQSEFLTGKPGGVQEKINE